MESTWEEYKEWSGDELDANIKMIYEKSLKKLKVIMPYEKTLVS